MCFYGNLSELKIAQEPIDCIKIMELYVIDGKYRLNSQIYPSKDGYDIGDEITAHDLADDEFANLINGISVEYSGNDAPVALNGEVVHSYACNGSIPDKWIAKGLTGFITLNPYYISVVCEIPKGTVYITNKSREIASRKVIIKGVLCEPILDEAEE
jgi:hypothetical protein